MPEDKTTFAETLGAAMEGLGLSAGPTALRDHLALRGHTVTVAACSIWLTGTGAPKRSTLPVLADALDISEPPARLAFYEQACAVGAE